MTNERSWHASNAERQKKQTEDRVTETIKRLRSEVTGAYDSQTGRYRYPHNGGRLNHAEFLRRAKIDKNTLKADYHQRSRARVNQFLDWAILKCATEPDAAGPSKPGRAAPKAEKPRALDLARQERDDAAEKFAVSEVQLSDALQRVEELTRRLADKDERVEQLEGDVIRLKAIILGLDPAISGNVVDHPTRRR